MEQLLDSHSLYDFLALLSFISTGASLSLIVMYKLESVLEIWIPKTEDSHFWRTFDKLELTFKKISMWAQRKNGNAKQPPSP